MEGPPTLAEARARLDGLIAGLESRLDGVTDAQLDRVPPDGGWCARQVLSHLTIAVRLYDACLRRMLARPPGRMPSAAAPGRPGWFARLLLRALPNRDRRFRAPRVFDPDRAGARVDVAAALEAHRALAASAAEVEARGLGEVRIGTPVSRFLRMRAREAVAIQALHGERHLAQLERSLA